MSYMKDLDEYRSSELRGELDRRAALDAQGKCVYCEHDILSDPPCKFPTRHKGMPT